MPRPWLIERLLQKLNGQEDSHCVLLTAPAGFGKSVVMEELCWGAEGWVHSGAELNISVVARHFCRHDRENSLDPKVFVCNLAGMLAASLPEYSRHLRDNPDLQRRFAQEELQKEGGCSAAVEFAVYEPLLELHCKERLESLNEYHMALIVVDALDEAALRGSDHTIVGLLRELGDLLSSGELPWLKVVCSSRRDVGVDEQLQDACR